MIVTPETLLLPSGWQRVLASEHLTLESGQRPSQYVTDDPKDVPSWGGENITDDGFISLENQRFISREYFRANGKGRVQVGDILLNKDGANTGKLAFVYSLPSEEVTVNEHVFIIRNKGEFDQRFLFEFLHSYLGQKQIKSLIIGSAQPGLNTRFTRHILLPKPAIDEQRRIGSLLLGIDQTVTAARASIAKAEQLQKALRQVLFTGKMTPGGVWRKPEEFWEHKRLGLIPIGWRVERLGDVTAKITDGEHLTPAFQDSGSLLLSAEDVFDEGIRLEKAKFVKRADMLRFRKRCGPDKGDVLIVSRGASVGRMVQIDEQFALMGSVILIKPSVVESIYIAQYLKTFQAWAELRRLSGTTAQQAIYIAHAKKMLIPFPMDTDKQKEIGRVFVDLDALIHHKRTKIAAIQRLKKSLMQNLLTGRVLLPVEGVQQKKATA
jgi:type I restriction enzyme S subunit